MEEKNILKREPIRTCVICKVKLSKRMLLGFYLLDGELVFDINNKVGTRKSYVCHRTECLNRLDHWLKRKSKKVR